MVSESRGERVHLVLLTAYPSSSSHGRSRSICVERPTPSVPSIAIRWPGNRFSERYGSPCPYQVLPRFGSDMVSLCALAVIVQQHFLDDVPDDALLFGNLAGSIDRSEPEFARQFVVNFQHPALEQPEAFGGIGR